MWADVNTKPTQGKRFRFMHGHVISISEDYDDNVKRRRTHTFFLPKIESERLSVIDREVLEKAAIIMLKKHPTKETKKRMNVLFPPQTMLVEKQMSGLGEGKYYPGVEPALKAESACFLPFTKPLLTSQIL